MSIGIAYNADSSLIFETVGSVTPFSQLTSVFFEIHRAFAASSWVILALTLAAAKLIRKIFITSFLFF